MNIFQYLDAQSPESRLARLSSDEISEANEWFDQRDAENRADIDSSARPVAPASRDARENR